MSYYDIYRKRANRYGNDFQSRLQGEREKLFDLYLLKSIYRVDFVYDGEMHPGSFEKYRQDETKTLHYLLTKVDLKMPGGTVLMIPNEEDKEEPWMVFYLEKIKASGYNRYIMLRMTHFLEWTQDNTKHQTWSYLYGPKSAVIADTINAMHSAYHEDQKSNFFIMPKNEFVKKDTYFEVGEDPFKEYFRVTGYDVQSTDGVEYVTLDPFYKKDLTPAPEQKPGESDDDFFWINGGA